MNVRGFVLVTTRASNSRPLRVHNPSDLRPVRPSILRELLELIDLAMRDVEGELEVGGRLLRVLKVG